MNLTEAHEEAALIERHRCLHVELIVNAVGALGEMGIEPPPFSMRATAWFPLIRHDGEGGLNLHGWGKPIEMALMEAYWVAMARHGMNCMDTSDIGSEFEPDEYCDPDWRCPVHEA